MKTSRRLSPQLLPLVLLLAVVGCAAAAGSTATAGRQAVARGERPELQRMLDALVEGPGRIAPGVTAYVSGPHGTWTAAAGVANVKTGEPMRPSTRLRLASVSKTWTATLILRLARSHMLSLDDTVEHWAPRLLPYGRLITLRQLLNHTSGMIDSNDIVHSPNRYISQVKDRPQGQVGGDRKAMGEGSRVRDLAPRVGRVRRRATAAARPRRLLPLLQYRLRPRRPHRCPRRPRRPGHTVPAPDHPPLNLTTAAYDPHSKITGPHAHGYSVAPNGKLKDTTTWTMGIGAGKHDLQRSRRSTLPHLADAGQAARPRGFGRAEERSRNGYGLGTSVAPSGCAGTAYGHNGGLDG